MSKSKYPNQIDTSSELPVAKDNILQVGTNAINSLRSAIIQIEKTLGINPQGYEGNTVSERLNMSLDSYGFLKDDAIDKLNLLKGPVKNSNVANEAGIKESKLDLDFSTNFLYNQTNSLFRDLETFSSELKDISSKLSLHLNSFSLNSHIAKNISVEAFVQSDSPTVTRSLPADMDLQTFIESLYSSHINYTGENITSGNSSHNANQIYYNNLLENRLTADSVQGAIDELSNTSYNLDEEHQKVFHSNGILKVISKDKNLLITNQSVSFSQYSALTSETGTRILFSTPITDVDLEKSDSIEITSSGVVYYFTYKSKILNSDSKIESIDIYEDIYFDSSSATLSGYNNVNINQDKIGLCLSSFEASSGTNSSKVVVINPNSTYLISDKVFPYLITSSNQNFILEVDGIEYTINCYSSVTQTIDSIIANINNKLSGSNASAIAFRVDDDFSRIGISHLIENSSSFTGKLKIKQGSDNSYSDLGFSSIVDKEFSGSSNYSYYINGSKKDGLLLKLSSSLFTIGSATKTLTFSSTISLKTYGVKKGDLISISGSSSDDGTYSIDSVSDFEITIDSNNNFTGQIQSDSINFYIYHNTIDLRDLAFESLLGSNKASLIEFYLKEDRSCLKTNILEYSPPISSSNYSLVQIVDVKNNFNYDGQFTLSKDNDDFLYIENDNGTIIKLPDDDSFYFNLKNELNKLEMKIFIEDSTSLKTYIQNNGSQTISYYLKSSLNKYDKIVLGSCLYENFRGRLAGSDHIRFNHGKNFGMLTKKDISNSFIEEYFGSFDYKTRSNGILSGCRVFDESIASGVYSFKVTSGECIVGGKRIVIDYTEITTSISDLNDRLYIAVDLYGNIVFSVPNATCDLPFNLENYTILSIINKGVSGLINYDLRLFLNKIDQKVLNEILVSPVSGVGHFSKLSDAVKYARMIRHLSDDYGTPIIKLSSGIFKETVTHSSVAEADYLTQAAYNNIYKDGIWIDFPVIIEGAGSETVLDLENIWSDTASSDDKVANQNLKGGLYIAGNGIGSTKPTYGLSSALSGGDILIKNLKLKQSRVYLIDQLSLISSVIKEEIVKIENVIFEEDPTVFDTKSFYYVKEDISLDSSNKFGNIKIKECKFVNSGKSYDSDSDIYIQNANYLDNFFIDNTSSAKYIFNFVDGTSNPIRTFGNATGSSGPFYEPLINYSNNYQYVVRLAQNTVDTKDGATNAFKDELNVRSINSHSTSTFYSSLNAINCYGRINLNSPNGALLIQSSYDPSYPTSIGTNSKFTQDVKIDGDLEIVGNLNISGTKTGKDYSNIQMSFRNSATTGPILLGDLGLSTITSAGHSALSYAVASIGPENLLTLPYDAKIKKYSIKNMNNNTFTGKLKIYTIDNNLDITVASNYTEIYNPLLAFPFVAFYGYNPSVESSVISAFTSIIFVFEMTSGSYYDLSINLVLEYDIT